MRFQSPLSNLCDTLLQIRESAKQYQSTLISSEAATRAALIDPVLRALGWDIANTNMVEVERTIGKVRADYTLYDSSTSRIIVEAKCLGADLSNPIIVNSLPQYAFNFQVGDIFLTDGIRWLHYSNFQPTNFKPTRVIDISKDNTVHCAAYLVQTLDAAGYWPVEQTIDVISQRIDQLESQVATLQKLVSTIPTTPSAPATPSATSTANTSSSNAPSATNLAFVELSKVPDATGKRPTHLRLPDDTTISVKRWKDVLRECCKYALSNNPSIPIPLADKSARKVSLFSTLKPGKDVSYVTELYNGQDVFIYTNYDANNCIANSLHVLKHVPASAQKVAAAVVVTDQ
jgi:hypothetical protein